MHSESSRPQSFRLLIGVFTALVLATPAPAHAQFGALKKLKDKVTGAADSAKTDSTKSPTDTTKPKNQSIFAKAASMAGAASDKLEATTGISAKDAALAATGAGAANLISKKVGGAGDGSGVTSALSKALTGGGVNPAQGATAAPQGMLEQLAAAKMAAGAGRANNIVGEQKQLLAFQQELMQVGMKASAGDAVAKARLEAWQNLIVRYQDEIGKWTIAGSGGDVSAARRLQELQLRMMREWQSGSTVKVGKP
ncbi:MAG: hypothetical protein ABJD07_01965 [Gemmatimonadaceae bacterium]